MTERRAFVFKGGVWLAGVTVVAMTLLWPGGSRAPAAAAQGSTTTLTSTPASTAAPSIPATTLPSPTTVASSAPSTLPSATSTTRPEVTTTVPAGHAVTVPSVSVTFASTTVSSTTSTTIASIFGHLPVAPSTVPFNTKGSNAHFDTKLGWLSAGGFALAALIILIRLVLTRPSRRDQAINS